MLVSGLHFSSTPRIRSHASSEEEHTESISLRSLAAPQPQSQLVYPREPKPVRLKFSHTSKHRRLERQIKHMTASKRRSLFTAGQRGRHEWGNSTTEVPTRQAFASYMPKSTSCLWSHTVRLLNGYLYFSTNGTRRNKIDGHISHFRRSSHSIAYAESCLKGHRVIAYMSMISTHGKNEQKHAILARSPRQQILRWQTRLALTVVATTASFRRNRIYIPNQDRAKRVGTHH